MSRIDGRALMGIGLMACVAALSALDAVIVRLLAGAVHPFFMGFTRAAFGLVAMLPWILARPGILHTGRHWLHALRALLKLLSLVALFGALAGAPLAQVTAIGFAAPIFVALGAWAFLGETPRRSRTLAMILGFAGVLIVLRPQGGISPALALALVSALLLASIQLLLKYMGAKEKSDTLTAWNLVFMVPIALVPAIWVWAEPSPYQWALLAAQGAMGAFNQLLATRAFQLGDASLIAPIDFLRLPMVAWAGYVLFEETVGTLTWAGAAVIFLSVLLMMASSGRRSAR